MEEQILGDETTMSSGCEKVTKISKKMIYPVPKNSGGMLATSLVFTTALIGAIIFGTGWVICQIPKTIKKIWKFAVVR
jgi:hypothetical protein